MTFLRETISDTFKYTLLRVASMVIGAIALPFLSRVFSPAEYAIYSTVLATLAYYVLFSTSWINNSVIRFYDEYKSGNSVVNLMSTSIITTLIICLVTTIVVFFIYLFTDYFTLFQFFIIIPIIVFKSLISIFNNYSRAQQKALTTGIVQLVDRFSEFAFGFPILFLALFSKITSFYVGMLIGESIIIVYYIYIVFKDNIFNFSTYQLNVLKIIFFYGFPLLASNIATMISDISTRYLLLYFHGPQNTGIYTFVADLSSKTVNSIPQLLTFALLPIFIKYSNRDFQFTISKIRLFYKLFLLGIFPFIIGLVYFRYEFFSFFGTEEYIKGVPLLPIFFIGAFLNSLNWFWVVIQMLQKKSKQILKITVIYSLINILPNCIFISFTDFTFPVYTYLLSVVVNFLLTLYFVRKDFSEITREFLFALKIFTLVGMYAVIRYFTISYFKINENEIFLNVALTVPIIIFLLLYLVIFIRKNRLEIKS